jgi:hypothetical protein
MNLKFPSLLLVPMLGVVQISPEEDFSRSDSLVIGSASPKSASEAISSRFSA